MKVKTHMLLLLTLATLMVACKEKEVIFTYSPEEPRAGETIKFTNSTAEGETWEWTFGDGTTATTKSPSKVYKRPGTYTVVLTVDKKHSRRYSTTLTVVDTIPTITLAEDSLVYFLTPVKLQMSAYNPYNYTKTYQWVLNDDVELLEGDLDDEYITVLFGQYNREVEVGCVLTIGEAEYDCTESFYVRDTLAPTLYMKTNGEFRAQRMFAYGEDEPVGCTALEMDSRVAKLLRSTTCTYHGDLLYWAEGSSICREPAGVWTDVTHIGYGLAVGGTITGLAWYNDICMLAYDKGIYRFRESDIDSGSQPEAGAILTDVTVKAFVVDSIAKKIYYLTSEGLNVCNISGTNPRLLVSGITGKALCVDNVMGRIYWAQADGVWYMPLVQAANNATTEVAVYLNGVAAQTMAFDPTLRYGL